MTVIQSLSLTFMTSINAFEARWSGLLETGPPDGFSCCFLVSEGGYAPSAREATGMTPCPPKCVTPRSATVLSLTTGDVSLGHLVEVVSDGLQHCEVLFYPL